MAESKTVTVTASGYSAAIPSKGETSELWTAYLFWKVADGTSADNAALTWGGSSVFTQGWVASYSGADTTTPIGVASAAFQDNNTASTNAAFTQITTLTDNNLPLGVVYNDQGGVTSIAAGWTEDVDQASGPEVSHKNSVITPAGVTGTPTATLTGTFRSITGMVALQPPQVVTAPQQTLTLLGVGT